MLSLALKEEETMDQEEEELQEEKDVSSVDKMGILLVNVLTLKEKEILEVLPETILIQEVREITEEAIVSRATQNLNLMRALLEESLWGKEVNLVLGLHPKEGRILSDQVLDLPLLPSVHQSNGDRKGRVAEVLVHGKVQAVIKEAEVLSWERERRRVQVQDQDEDDWIAQTLLNEVISMRREAECVKGWNEYISVILRVFLRQLVNLLLQSTPDFAVEEAQIEQICWLGVFIFLEKDGVILKEIIFSQSSDQFSGVDSMMPVWADYNIL